MTMKFGKIAVEMGLINNEFLQTSLRSQKQAVAANKLPKKNWTDFIGFWESDKRTDQSDFKRTK